MDDTLIAQIQRFTIDTRHMLEQEAREQLEGLYGWLPDGSFAKANLYPALNQLEEARQTRRKLEGYVMAEKDAGFSAVAARQKLIRETAFTWLNRFVALRMMEERRLVKTAVSRLIESNAYLFWLADEIDPEARKLHDKGETPVNAMGEGPRHVVYRRFLLWQCGTLAREVSVLFDPDTLASCLFPRPNILKSLIENMNMEVLADAWKPGNEETIGWVYQAFNAEEKDEVFAGFQNGKKVTPEQIAPATQVFTPRWVVRFLIENSVGRLWIEMHPDSRLKDTLSYLVPIDRKGQRQLKPVREITFLDPATGSMHFGLVAFDIFCEMYREELENAGKPGWPEKPSVETHDDIPASIIFHNLYGIDIDLRAIQLSALILFLRSRSVNPKCPFTDKNLACANIEQITGGRLEEFIRQAKFSHPIYERILRGMAVRLKDSDSLGSLLRPEMDLEQLIAEERAKAEKDKQLLLSFPGVTQEHFQTKEGLEDFFEILSEEISRHLDEFVRNTQSESNGARHFAAETAKGLRFLRLVQQRYDVVATNPPYIDSRDYSAVHKEFLGAQYFEAKRNLYSAFIQRAIELVKDQGLVAMITGQSFMFISTFEAFRKKLLTQVAIETLAQFDYHLFKERVDTTAFVLRQEPDEKERDKNEGIFFRLVRERDAEAKRAVFESTLTALRNGQVHPLLFRYCQRDFDAIPGKPWTYWVPIRVLEIFRQLHPLHLYSDIREGINTGDNNRFLRFVWEIGLTRVGKRLNWCLFAKGDRSYRYVNPTQYTVKNSIAEMSTLPGSRIFNTNYMFREAITFLSNSPKRFCAWWTPADHCFCSTGGRSIFLRDLDKFEILGLLNSSIVNVILSAVNPTISFKVGDVASIPIPEEKMHQIGRLAGEIFHLMKGKWSEIETEYTFLSPSNSCLYDLKRHEELKYLEGKIESEVSLFYGLSEEDLAAISWELSGASETSESDDNEGSVEKGEEETVAPMTPEPWAQTWISYAVGIVFGRFEVGVAGGLGCGNFSPEVVSELQSLAAPNGILTNDPGQPLDLALRVWQALEFMLGDEEARKRILTALGEGSPLELLNGWFDRFAGQPGSSFWKYHFQLYRKRPVYWPLQSPKRKFTVWVFHERFTQDTLFHIRNDIVEPRIRLAEREIADLRVRAESDRRARKQLDQLLDFRDDLSDFSKHLKEIADRGYVPHIDDGVLLNAAPLHKILPSWPETRKAWEELETGKYDWAQQAMEYWPDRVKEQCKTNKSFTIAHGLENLYEEKVPTPKKGRKRAK